MEGTKVRHNDAVHTIWTGWDNGGIYNIGDRFIWDPLENRPGVGPDGVYVAMDDPKGGVAVVISDGKFVEVGYYDPNKFEDAHQALEAKWPKVAPPRELWSEEVWARQEKRQEQMRKLVRRSSGVADG